MSDTKKSTPSGAAEADESRHEPEPGEPDELRSALESTLWYHDSRDTGDNPLGIRRAGEHEIKAAETAVAGEQRDCTRDGLTRDEFVAALIRERLLLSPEKLNRRFIAAVAATELPELRFARDAVDEHRRRWLRAALRCYPDAEPARCCEATFDFIAGRATALGNNYGCVLCRAILAAHEVAWTTALWTVRALLRDPALTVRRKEDSDPLGFGADLDAGSADLPRALVRLAYRADELAAKYAPDEAYPSVEPRVPITSGIRPLWSWLVSLASEHAARSPFEEVAAIHLGGCLGTVQIERAEGRVLDVVMYNRLYSTPDPVTRVEISNALKVEKAERNKKVSGSGEVLP